MAANNHYGSLQEFSPEKETITAYLERLKAYYDANDIPSAKRVPVLLSVIGPQTYSILRSLMAPDTPQSKSLAVLTKALKDHYDPKPIVIAERYHFHLRNQSQTENISEYVAELRRLAATCEFGEFLDDALRDRFVCGLWSEATRRRLLPEAKLTFARAVELAQCLEQADKDSKSFKTAEAVPVQKLSQTQRRKSGATQGPRNSTKSCYRCGRTNHNPSECHFIDATCNSCGKKGHISPVCRSKTSGRKTKSRIPNNTKYVSNVSTDADSDEEFYIGRIGTTTAQPIMVNIDIEGKTVEMEVDTGAAFSLISERTRKTLLPDLTLHNSRILLKTYTDERIKVLGQLHVHVSYGEQKAPLVLLVVDGEGPTLLGRNWLRYIKLDWKHIHRMAKSHGETQVEDLMEKHTDLFKDELGTVNTYCAKLHVEPGTTPKFFKARPVPFAIKSAIEFELDQLESDGIITKVTHSDWAAPIVPVPKKNGRFRICGDYKVTINQALDVDQYPLPKPEDLFTSLAGGKKFTILDLSQAYQQVQLGDESKQFVTINTHRGLYRYNRLPFGVASAPALFQKLMDSVLGGIPHVICYIDDILVTGTSDDDHIKNLSTVFERLEKYGFRLKREKCSLFQDSVEYLGHKINAEGLHAIPNKTKAVLEAPKPRNITELRAFLGMLSYYRKFIPDLSTLVHPLNKLLQKHKTWKWTQECQRAFEDAKNAMSSTQVLTHYDPSLPLSLAGDASAYGIGAVISHTLPDGSEKPIAFASRSLTSSEKNYAQLEKEALSLIFGVKKFHQYLYGRKFQLITDHQPLKAILGPKKGIPSLAAARLQRWAVLLSAYQYDIKFKPTDTHANADGLSRLPLPLNTPESSTNVVSIYNCSQLEALPVTASQIAVATRQDSVLSKVLRYTKHGWQQSTEEEDVMKPYRQRNQEITVEGDCLLWGTRVIIPPKHQNQMLKELHRDHPGCSRMKSLARSYMWWPRMDSDIESTANSCISCQSNKHAPPSAPLQPWTWPAKPWQRIHVDFAGPFLGKHFLVVIDAHSKWPEIFELSNTSASQTILILRRLFSSYGLPEQLVSDNGPQFVAEEFAEFLKTNGIRHTRCSPYHPASNGAVERFIQTFKQSMKASQNDSHTLQHRLMNFLLSYRVTPHATTNQSPCSLFLKRTLRTRFSLVLPNTESQVFKKQADQVAQHNQHAKSRYFTIGETVMARNFRPGTKWIPGTITKQKGPLTFIVQLDSGTEWKRHVDHIRKFTPTTTLETDTNNDLIGVDIPTTPDEDNPENNQENTQNNESSRYPSRSREPPDRTLHLYIFFCRQ